MTLNPIKTAENNSFGRWSSPITSSLVIKDAIQLYEIQIFGTDAYWIEKRPLEKGRCVIVKSPLNNFLDETSSINQITDVLSDKFSARSRVHEYGGASYTVTSNGIFFVNDIDQQIYQIDAHNNVSQLTYSNNCRFTDMVHDETRRCLICVCEDHAITDREPTNSIVSINISNGALTTLCEGYDFYSNPRLSNPKTSDTEHSNHNPQLCWLCWNHPNMPWDGTELWTADYSANQVKNSKQVAGNENISISQPLWSPNNALTYISDESDWWNLYQLKDGITRNLFPKSAEFGVPQWVFGQSSYQYFDNNTIHCIFSENTTDYLAELKLSEQTFSIIETNLSSLSSIQTSENSTWFIGASSTLPPQITSLKQGSRVKAIRLSYKTEIDKKYFSVGQHIQFKTRHNDTAYAIYYPPQNGDVDLPNIQQGKIAHQPPLIVISHGGPTAQSNNAFDIRKQFWTSRGFAILDVNYSGSTGFGRQYRERLKHNWGIRDVEDCCDAALHAVNAQLADPEKLIIKGSSAGGYSVLCALTYHDLFSVGASYYGIGNLESLASDTHKFESRYLDKLIGEYPACKNTYQDRSPINHVEKLNCPVIFFQGEDDNVVPQEQAEQMVAAIQNKGLPVSYLLFKGEGHGFRKSDTIELSLNAEYFFYSKLFGFETDNYLNPIEIYNFDQ